MGGSWRLASSSLAFSRSAAASAASRSPAVVAPNKAPPPSSDAREAGLRSACPRSSKKQRGHRTKGDVNRRKHLSTHHRTRAMEPRLRGLARMLTPLAGRPPDISASFATQTLSPAQFIPTANLRMGTASQLAGQKCAQHSDPKCFSLFAQ